MQPFVECIYLNTNVKCEACGCLTWFEDEFDHLSGYHRCPECWPDQEWFGHGEPWFKAEALRQWQARQTFIALLS
jgi:hypothetical protein